jgi:CubicO group peptidase (beta-lactamase class C family)
MTRAQWKWVGVVVTAAALGAASCAEPTVEMDEAAYRAGEVQFPGEVWAQAADPAALGWNAAALAQARELYEGLESAGFLAAHRGVVIASWGDVGAPYTVQSARKSLLSALIGQEVAAGRLDLEATLEELGVGDENPALDPAEQRATVRDLLHTSSGIYHSALYEAGSWKRNKPERGAHLPGSHWYYNNWDFNALGTIFERSAGRRIGAAFEERVARPIGMEDFRASDVDYLTRRSLTEKFMKNASVHDAYVFRVSTRDLARFGLLYQEGGAWEGRQVVPRDWVRASWQDAVPIGEYEEWFGEDVRYGYLWWVIPGPQYGAPAGTEAYVAQGARGHQVVVIPALDMVFAHEVATGGVGFVPQLWRRFFGSPEVSDGDVERLVAAVIAAAPVLGR